MTKINAYLNILNESPKIVARIEKEPVDLQIISKLIKSVFPEAAFKEPVYKSLLPLTLVATINEQGSENMRAAQENAAMLTILFGDAEEAIKFLTRYEKQYPHRERLVHDACLFSLPEGKNWNVELWQALASKHMPEKKIFRSLPFAEKIEAYVTLEFQNIKNSIRENVVHDYELTLSQEYDEEHEEKHTKLIERKINKSFQDYIKQLFNA